MCGCECPRVCVSLGRCVLWAVLNEYRIQKTEDRRQNTEAGGILSCLTRVHGASGDDAATYDGLV